MTSEMRRQIDPARFQAFLADTLTPPGEPPPPGCMPRRRLDAADGAPDSGTV